MSAEPGWTFAADIGEPVPGQEVAREGSGPERSLARVCREAGATVRTNTLLRDMNLCVPAGLPLHHGAQLAVDITQERLGGMRWGPPKCISDGAVLAAARREKERKYHELLVSERCRLVVVAMETVADGATRPLSRFG